MRCPKRGEEARIVLSDTGGIAGCSLWKGDRPECRGECLHAPLVVNVMQTEVIAVRDTLPVAVLAGLLSEKEISGVPVVDDGKRLVGVVSRADLVRPPELSDETVMVDELLDGFAPEPKSCVRDVMSRTLHQVDESASLKDAIELMLRERIHRLVVTREGAVTGIVTSFDMMKMLAIVLRS